MSLTRIGSIGINTGIAFAGVTTIVTLNTANDALSIGATVNVGSGITLGASGDIFATGVCTAASFSGSGANLTGIDTDLVSDTSPQLGGNLDVNTKNIVFGDSSDGSSDDVLKFGAGSDLQIYHDGTNSYVKNNTGVLYLQGDNIRFLNDAGNENIIKAFGNGAVELYHNGTKKFETTSSGVTLGDGLLLDNATNAGRDVQWQPANDRLAFLDNTRATFGNEIDLSIYHDGSHSRIVDSGTGHLIIQTSELDLMNAAGNADLIKATAGGSVELYENGTKVAETTSGGWNVEGVTYSNGLDMDDNHKILLGLGDDLQIYHDGSHSYVSDTSTGNLKITSNGTAVQIEKSDGENMAVFRTDGAVELYHDNSKKVETNSTGINMVDKVIMFQGQGSRVIKYRDGENDMIYEGAAGFFMRQNIGDSRHEFFVGNNKKVSVTDTGITFGNDTAAANALDDYEEGTWTVGIESRAVSGSEGLYTKIGRFVACQFALNGLNASTTQANISGLPFTSRNTNQIGLCQIGDVRGVTYSSGFSNIYGRVNANVTNVQILQQESNGSSHTSNMTLNTNVILRGYIWYMTA